MFARFVRRTAAMLLLAGVSLCGPQSAKSDNPESSGPAEYAKLSPEVRLRKLHLVRPDLIPYPIAYEIYC
ncbi:MAG: hypothetical protein ACREJC_11210 [Tepidisphaeraceae bacterium]